MNLYPLTSSIAIKIGKASRKLMREVITNVNIIDSLIVLGDGTPDDIGAAIACHHLNGEKTAGIVKPEKTGLAALESINSYLQQPVRKILFLVDQDAQQLDLLFTQAERKLRDKGIHADLKDKDNRLRSYECKSGSKKFKLIIVVNGVEEVTSGKHTIEDHFIAGRIKVKGDSKTTWQSLNENQRNEIFKELVEDQNKAKNALPQQFSGCRKLK